MFLSPSPGGEMLSKLLKMQLLEDDDELAYASPSEDQEKAQGDGRPAWMRTLAASLTNWMKLVPKVRLVTSNDYGICMVEIVPCLVVKKFHLW